MEKEWDGKTKGNAFGYNFFISSIRILGLRFSYFICYFVAAYFILFSGKHRRALVKFYREGFNYSKSKSIRTAAKTFYKFGQILIDRIALKTKRKKQFTHSFDNEKALVELYELGQGGFLMSAHIGNWENAGDLIGERITSKINILMLDAEVEKIKGIMEANTEKSKFNLITLKDDMSHLILIYQALKRNELVALHADRILDKSKTYSIPFLNQTAKFPSGPFIMAHKFKVPITFVFALKTTRTHYALNATDLIHSANSPEELAEKYVNRLEEMVKKAPDQWFNFYDFYAN